MARIAKFYERLPKGAAPDRATGGPIGWYQAKYFGKNPSAARKSHPATVEVSRDGYSSAAGSPCWKIMNIFWLTNVQQSGM